MKTIIAGGRDMDDPWVVKAAIDSCPWAITEVVSGMARGVDFLAVRYARKFGLPLHEFPADWTRYGRRAGHIRNAEMAHFADALIAVWDGRSRGTSNMIQQARQLGLRVHIHRYSEDAT